MKIPTLLTCLALAILAPSCAPLAGTRIDFDETGAVTVTPPQKPIAIPVHPSK